MFTLAIPLRFVSLPLVKQIMNNNVWIYVSSVVSRIYKSNKVGAILSSSNPLLNYIISGLYDQKYFERS